MTTGKQKAAARRNIKKAQRARWAHKPHKTGRVRAPADQVSAPLDRIETLI